MQKKTVVSRNIAVVGLGNILLTDEGVGIRVVEELQHRYTFSPAVKLIDGGTLGFALIHDLHDCHKLIVVDAVQGGETPGTLYRFTEHDIETKTPLRLSAHDIGFLEVLQQWHVLDYKPDIVFLGVEPKNMKDWGMTLSPCIQQQMQRIIDLVVQELQKEGVTCLPADRTADQIRT